MQEIATPAEAFRVGSGESKNSKVKQPLQGHNPVFIKELLHEEIKKVASFKISKEQYFKPIILSAIEKLKPYVDDQKDICSILKKTFDKEFDRDITRYCPEEFKRSYESTNADIPFDDLSELLSYMEDAGEDIAVIAHEIKKKYAQADGAEREEINELVTKIFGSLAELKNKLTEWKELSVEVSLIRQRLDSRLKVDDFSKSLLRIMSFYETNRKLAKLFGIKRKWVAHILHNSQEMDIFLEKLLGSDPRLESRLKWFKENKRRQESGLEPLPPLA